MDREEARLLASATRIWRNLQGLLRLTVGRSFEPEAAPEALKRRPARPGRPADFPTLEPTTERRSGTDRPALPGQTGEPAGRRGAPKAPHRARRVFIPRPGRILAGIPARK